MGGTSVVPYISVRTLLPGRYGSHGCLYMLKVYFYETGDYTDPKITVVGMGGCIASEEQWEHFEREWANNLDRFQVEDLHMRELRPLSDKSQYKKKGWDNKKRDTFLEICLSIMDKYVTEYIRAVLPVSEWHDLRQDQQAQLSNDPYFACFQACLYWTMTKAKEAGVDEKVELFFDRKPKGSGMAGLFYDLCYEQWETEDRLKSITFANRKDVLPLQAADLVAYELQQLGKQMLNPKKIPFDEMHWILRKLLGKDHYFDYHMEHPLSHRF